MKILKSGLLAIATVAMFSACGNKSASSDGMPTTSDSLQIALANQDSLLAILNDISDGMNSIKQMENMLSSGSVGAETPDEREQIRQDMMQIQQALQQRRQRLEELEKQLASSNRSNANLKLAIKNLKAQIEEQTREVESLRAQLADANIKIEGLNETVTTLGEQKDSIANVANAEATARKEAERQATELNNEMNTCYYAIGTNKELKNHHLLESGFLRSTKVLPQNFDQSYFTKGDKRELRTINLHSKKAKVMTNQPADSYEIVEGADKVKILKITNPARFWNQSNFLVIKID